MQRHITRRRGLHNAPRMERARALEAENCTEHGGGNGHATWPSTCRSAVFGARHVHRSSNNVLQQRFQCAAHAHTRALLPQPSHATALFSNGLGQRTPRSRHDRPVCLPPQATHCASLHASRGSHLCTCPHTVHVTAHAITVRHGHCTVAVTRSTTKHPSRRALVGEQSPCTLDTYIKFQRRRAASVDGVVQHVRGNHQRVQCGEAALQRRVIH